MHFHVHPTGARTSPEVAHQRSLGAVWFLVSAVLCTYTAVAWITTKSGVRFRVSLALFSIVVCSFLLSINSLIGLRFSIRASGTWVDRIPIVGLSVDSKTIEATIIQMFQLSVYILLPAGALVHFWDILRRGYVVTTGNNAHLVDSIWSWSAMSTFDDPARVCSYITQIPFLECELGVTFFPGLEPTLLAIASGVVIVATSIHLRSIFRRNTETKT